MLLGGTKPNLRYLVTRVRTFSFSNTPIYRHKYPNYKNTLLNSIVEGKSVALALRLKLIKPNINAAAVIFDICIIAIKINKKSY